MSIFNQVNNAKPRSNTFDLSHDRKMSLKMGRLVPIHCQEIIPGDKITMSTSQMLRMAPMIAPVMHKVNVYTHFYFVPNRILWKNWQNFITGGEDGQDTSVFPIVKLDAFAVTPGSIADYMGLPINTSQNVSALPFYAYNMIYNEYYRDQNIIPTKLPQEAIDGENSSTGVIPIISGEPMFRAWAHDYFTSALPWTQKGSEATIPLGTTAPINWIPAGVGDIIRDAVTGDPRPGQEEFDSQAGGQFYTAPSSGGTSVRSSVDNTEHLSVDLSLATASTINDLRRAFKLQEWLEKNARGGSRYTETILSHFNVHSSDSRLQRPEYLGGGASPMTISEVLQTSSLSSDFQDTPQGNMAGHGISVGANTSFSYRSEEHGYIIGIMSIMPKSAYQQGIPKHFKKWDKFDYYWPSFAHLGEQPIMNYELYANGSSDDEEVFGYTPRYAEYKFINSSVHGEFRTSLDFWHMGRTFAIRPTLNEDFISCQPTTRIFAVEDAETIYAHVFHRIKAKRLMPYFGTPAL